MKINWNRWELIGGKTRFRGNVLKKYMFWELLQGVKKKSNGHDTQKRNSAAKLIETPKLKVVNSTR